MIKNKNILTAKQEETLKIIRNYLINTGYSPTIKQLSNDLNVKSLRSVSQRLEALERKGLIRRDKFKHNGITLLENLNPGVPSSTLQVPILASAGCDAMQVYAQEQYDQYLTIDKSFAKQAKDIVAIKAVGNSMVDVGINNGDYVLVEVTENVSNGDRVVAIIGDMAVIKRYQKTPNAIVLNPESKFGNYSPIVMKEDFKIFGKVLSVISAGNKEEQEYTYEKIN